MDFLSYIKTRRSIRVFEEKDVDIGILKKIIEIATYAPSACNLQGWRFIIVKNDQKKQQIIDHGGSVNIKKAPIGILVIYDNKTQNVEYNDHVQSAAAAIQNLLLAAHYFGLGTCWICHLPVKKQLRKIFNIPKFFSPIAYIMIGYQKKEPNMVPRKYQLEDLICFDNFTDKIAREQKSCLKRWIKKILIKIYYLLPSFIKRGRLNKYIDKKFVKKFEN